MLNRKLILEWKNINFSIKENKKEKDILTNISGHVKSNNLLGILGSSGSGKTSLINILANKVKKDKKNKLTGSVKLNNKCRNQLNFKKISAYIQQEDILYPQMSVYETFLMTAQLRLPKEMPIEEGRNS